MDNFNWWYLLFPVGFVLLKFTILDLDWKTGNPQKMCAFCRSRIDAQAVTCRYCAKDQPKK